MELLGDHAVTDAVHRHVHLSRTRFDHWIAQTSKPHFKERDRPLPSASLTEHVFRHAAFSDHSALERRVLPVLRSLGSVHLARRVLQQVARNWPCLPVSLGPCLPFKIWRTAAQELQELLPPEFICYSGLFLHDTGELDLLHTTSICSQIDSLPFSFFTLVDFRSVYIADDHLLAIRARLGLSLKALLLHNSGVTEKGFLQAFRPNAEHFAKLQVLWMTGCKTLGDPIADVISNLPSLCVLNLSGTSCSAVFHHRLNKPFFGVTEYQQASSAKHCALFDRHLPLTDLMALLDGLRPEVPAPTPQVLVRGLIRNIQLAEHRTAFQLANTSQAIYTPALGWISGTVNLDRDSVFEEASRETDKGAAFRATRGGAVAGGRRQMPKAPPVIPEAFMEAQVAAFFASPPVAPAPLEASAPPQSSPLMLLRLVPAPPPFQPGAVEPKPLAAKTGFISRKKEAHEWRSAKAPAVRKTSSELDLLGLAPSTKRKAELPIEPPSAFGAKRRGGLAAFSGKFVFKGS